MSNKVLGVATQILVMGIVISVILLFVGIGFLVLIHVCIVGRAFRRGFSSTGNMVERGSIGSTSMSHDDLEKLPCFDFKAREKGSSPVDCAVCLENFKMGDKCRLLPKCNHSFHAQCIDSWLLKTPICPICRTSVDSQKGSMVSSEETNRSTDIRIELSSNPSPLRASVGLIPCSLKRNQDFIGDGLLPVPVNISPKSIRVLEGTTPIGDISVPASEGEKPTVESSNSIVEGEKSIAATPCTDIFVSFPDDPDTSSTSIAVDQVSNELIEQNTDTSEEANTHQKATTVFDETGLQGTFVIDLGLPRAYRLPRETRARSLEQVAEQTKKEGEKKKKMGSLSSPHFVIFPFMAQGHTIPLLHLANLLHRRSVTVTIFTTPANSPSILRSLNYKDISIINLPFPENVPGLPSGVESTDKLPSMAFFIPFANSTKLMQPHFEKALSSLPKVSCIISDGFFGWTQQSATKFGIPRLVFYGMSNYSMAISKVVTKYRPYLGLKSDDEPFDVPCFPWVKLTRNDLEPPFCDPEPKGEYSEFVMEQIIATSKSQGLVVNSFHELEPSFHDYWNSEVGPRAWCVGPVFLAEPQKVEPQKKSKWVQWLDAKLAEGRSVLYVAFGSQADILPEQLREIAIGLEKSKMNFLWVVRSKGLELNVGFEERVKDRGLVVKEWVDQREILGHESVNGFMSHCGWNSVLETICASVPILALPLMAEQHLNARMAVDELGIGLRILAENGSVRGFVRSEAVEKMVRELMEGEMGKEVRKKVKEMEKMASGAMEQGGSSWRTLDLLIEDVCGYKR
ncbi:hypothetical protein HHK36_007076 [Tetracentron sinense]|uniref:RING-type domain-containing protein n=1 Tax=Tetracentron sinense TaxID=13715 RepID=A0A834ZJ50_TETSI|nr:hypothetical protein HHK36_007076 [Tetracentron sinense]